MKWEKDGVWFEKEEIDWKELTKKVMQNIEIGEEKRKKAKVFYATNNMWKRAVNNLVKEGVLNVEQANQVFDKINKGGGR
jgi:hypothetical protein